jgi:Zn-dependent peptidase ImmA (M78 family)/transcriptional regulator with XRE-family HTH domain
VARLKTTRANPTLIEWARRNSGCETDRIASRLRLTPEEYMAVERGERSLTLAQLRSFADLVKRPLATFYLASSPPDVVKPHDYRSSTGRIGREAMLSFRKAERVQESSRIPFKQDSSLFTLRPSLNLPPARLAARAREAIGLTDERQAEFRSGGFSDWLVMTLQSLGVHVLFHAYPTEEAKAYTLPGEPPVIVINRRDYATSQLFSLLHELCHLLLRKPGMCDAIGPGGGSSIERYCNQFAASFLIPTDWLSASLSHIDIDALEEDDVLARLASVFSTSRDVVVIKLIELGYLEQDAYQRYRWRRQSEQTLRRQGGRTSIKANALRDNGGLFVAEVADAYAANEVGVVEAAELLGINPGYVEDVVGVVGGAG